eukprot:403358336
MGGEQNQKSKEDKYQSVPLNKNFGKQVRKVDALDETFFDSTFLKLLGNEGQATIKIISSKSDSLLQIEKIFSSFMNYVKMIVYNDDNSQTQQQSDSIKDVESLNLKKAVNLIQIAQSQTNFQVEKLINEFMEETCLLIIKCLKLIDSSDESKMYNRNDKETHVIISALDYLNAFQKNRELVKLKDYNGLRQIQALIFDKIQHVQPGELNWNSLAIFLNFEIFYRKNFYQNKENSQELSNFIEKMAITFDEWGIPVEYDLDVAFDFKIDSTNQELTQKEVKSLAFYVADIFYYFARNKAYYQIPSLKFKKLAYLTLNNMGKIIDLNKIVVIRVYWGIGYLKLLTQQQISQLLKHLMHKYPNIESLARHYNFKDFQSLLESLTHIYESDTYNSELVQHLTDALHTRIKISKQGNQSPFKDEINIPTLHSYFKSYKELRHHNPEFYTTLTDELISMIHKGKADLVLMIYAMNRLSFLREKENFNRIYEVFMQKQAFKDINNSQNIVMLTQTLAMMEKYDIQLWISLLQQLLYLENIKPSQSMEFHRTLVIALELLEIDNQEIFQEKGTILGGLVEELRKIVQKDKLRQQSINNKVSRAHKFYFIALEKLGYQNIEAEKEVGPLNADIYIKDFDLIMEIHGPHHYKNNSEQLMDSSIYTERIFRKYHKNYMSIPYYYYDQIKSNGMDEDYEKGSLLLQELIQNALRDQNQSTQKLENIK